MSTRTKQPQAKPAVQASRGLSAAEVKTRLRESGETLRSWAKRHGYPYQTVSHVVRGINRGNYGLGHRIAVHLGLKPE